MLGILTFISMPFREDIRQAVTSLGLVLDDRLFDLFLAGALIGLFAVLVSKSDRAARACEDLREQAQKDLASHRTQLKKDLAKHREQTRKDLMALLDSRLNPITDGVGTLHSNVTALGSRIAALESRVSVLQTTVAALSDNT